MSNSSPVASHCSVFALSDTTDPDLQQQCDHSHDEVCEQCESLHSTLHSIIEAVKGAPFATEDDRDEAEYLANSITLSMKSWKCHLLRSAYQDQARLDVIGTLDPEAVLIINDWAMKFLPQRYRESITEWFGKRDLSWHISVVYRRIEGELQWQGFIHVIQSCSQGSSAVAAIMYHVLATLKFTPAKPTSVKTTRAATTPPVRYYRAPRSQPALEYKWPALTLAILKVGKGLQIVWLQPVKDTLEPLSMKSTMFVPQWT